MRTSRKLVTIGLATVLALGAVSVTFAQRGGGGGGRGGGVGPMGRMMSPAAPFIGITFERDGDGIKVTQVLEGSPAETAGLQVGDVIIAIGGEALTAGNIREALRDYRSGEALDLTVTRGEETLTVTVTLGEDPTPMRDLMRLRTHARIGAVLEADTLTVKEVLADSPAAEAGLQVGDTITAINGTAVTTRAEVAEALAAAHEAAEGEETTVTVTVSRGEESVDLTVTLRPVVAMMREHMPDFGGMGRGMFIQPREDGSGFDAVIPFTLSEGVSLTDEAKAALESLGWTVQAVEGEEGVYQLIIPAENLRGGLRGLRGMEGMGGMFDAFTFEFAMPDVEALPAAPAGAEL